MCQNVATEKLVSGGKKREKKQQPSGNNLLVFFPSFLFTIKTQKFITCIKYHMLTALEKTFPFVYSDKKYNYLTLIILKVNSLNRQEKRLLHLLAGNLTGSVIDLPHCNCKYNKFVASSL